MFAFWLLPAKPQAWQARIQRLAAEYGQVPFQPHVTLLSGSTADVDGLRDAAVEAVRGFPEFHWPLAGIDYGDTYFQCVFARFQLGGPAEELIKRLRKKTGHGERARLQCPHLSLVYGDLSTTARAAIAAAEPAAPDDVLFDRIAAVHPSGPNGWRDIDLWETWFTLPLLAT